MNQGLDHSKKYGNHDSQDDDRKTDDQNGGVLDVINSASIGYLLGGSDAAIGAGLGQALGGTDGAILGGIIGSFFGDD